MQVTDTPNQSTIVIDLAPLAPFFEGLAILTVIIAIWMVFDLWRADRKKRVRR